jgi:amphi-Trp domain-containing protein
MKADRDIDKTYPLPDFVAKLRRLADALEAGEPFDIQIAGERIYVPSRAIFSIEHEREEGHEEIEFQLRWQHAGEADEAHGTGEKSLAGDAAS